MGKRRGGGEEKRDDSKFSHNLHSNSSSTKKIPQDALVVQFSTAKTFNDEISLTTIFLVPRCKKN